MDPNVNAPGHGDWPRGLRVDAPDAPSGWWGCVWPIGALFFSTSDANPFDDLGFGAWQRFGSGQLLMGDPSASVNSVVSAPSSVHTQPVPTIGVYVWQRVS